MPGKQGKAARPPRAQRPQPQRTCVACRQTEGKRGLTRLVRTPEGRVELDPTGKRNGRGAYVHATTECVDGLLAGGGLARALKVEVSADTKQALRHGLRAVAHAEDMQEAR